MTMANAKKCDICGEFFDIYTTDIETYESIGNYTTKLIISADIYKKGKHLIDACKPCTVKVLKKAVAAVEER